MAKRRARAKQKEREREREREREKSVLEDKPLLQSVLQKRVKVFFLSLTARAKLK